MAKWVRGNTKQKGCYVCGRPLASYMSGQALVLDGSKGRIAVCSMACADKFDPGKVLEDTDLTGGTTGSRHHHAGGHRVGKIAGGKVRIKGLTPTTGPAPEAATPAAKPAAVKKSAAAKAAPAAKKASGTKKTTKKVAGGAAAKSAKPAATKKRPKSK